MKTLLRSFYLTLSTFTVLPMPRCKWEDRNFRFVLFFLPWAGGLIGVLLWGAAELLYGYGSIPLCAGLLLGLWVILTGGLHLDGLMDTCDGYFSRAPREKKLEILKDSRCGSFAVIGAVLVLLLKWNALGMVVTNPLALLWVPALCRAGCTLLILSAPERETEGFYAALRGGADKAAAGAGAALGLAFSLWLGGTASLWCAFGLLLWGVELRAALKRAFGGFSGDFCGAYIETAELLCLLILTMGGFL